MIIVVCFVFISISLVVWNLSPHLLHQMMVCDATFIEFGLLTPDLPHQILVCVTTYIITCSHISNLKFLDFIILLIANFITSYIIDENVFVYFSKLQFEINLKSQLCCKWDPVVWWYVVLLFPYYISFLCVICIRVFYIDFNIFSFF